MRFKNVGKDEYRNHYDVAAYWNWTFELTDTDAHAANPVVFDAAIAKVTDTLQLNLSACG